jgi:hypothetical protein
MASFLDEPYSTFSKRLTDWLNTAGGEVTNLTLDLFNRAQYRLMTYRPWEGLIVRQSLTLSSTKTSALPTDFTGTVISVYIDTDADGKPDMYFYRNGNPSNGYRLTNVFVKATGHSWTITFFATPSPNPVIVYPKALPDFAGTGTEYSFFPPDLLLAAAKAIHIEESDLVGDEYQAVLNNYATLLRDYEQANQYQNTEMRMAVLDDSGDEVGVDDYDMCGGSETDVAGFYDNSHDLG